MSKMDNLRAMREARYEAAQKRPKTATRPSSATPAPAPAPAPRTAKAAKAAPALSEPAAVEALCGHRNMSGRTCTREHGHAAKSHRYS
jgi:hypothetical protein